MMETTPGKRVRMFREHKGYKTASAFAEAAGLKVATLSSIETDRTSPSFDILATLAMSFPDLNTDWLLTGTGPMLRDGRALVPVEAPASTRQPSQSQQPTMTVVPESSLIQELKEDRNYWREMALSLMNIPQTGEPGKKPSPDSYAAEVLTIPAGFGAGRGARYTTAATTMQVEDRQYRFASGHGLLVIGTAEEAAA